MPSNLTQLPQCANILYLYVQLKVENFFDFIENFINHCGFQLLKVSDDNKHSYHNHARIFIEIFNKKCHQFVISTMITVIMCHIDYVKQEIKHEATYDPQIR
jgi:hypothetical protein